MSDLTPTTGDRHARRRGDAARQRIVSVLLARSEAGSPAYTLDELHGAIQGSKTNLRHHLEWLEERGVIGIQDALREVTRKEVVLLNSLERQHREGDTGSHHS